MACLGDPRFTKMVRVSSGLRRAADVQAARSRKPRLQGDKWRWKVVERRRVEVADVLRPGRVPARALIEEDRRFIRVGEGHVADRCYVCDIRAHL